MICEQCGEEIEDGEEYGIEQLSGYALHYGCVDDFFEEIKKNEVIYQVRGEEE